MLKNKAKTRNAPTEGAESFPSSFRRLPYTEAAEVKLTKQAGA